MSKRIVLSGLGGYGMGPCMPGGGCGYGGGYGCGFPLVGMFGMNSMWGNGWGNGCGGYGGGWGGGYGGGTPYISREIEMLGDTMNSRFDDTNGDVRTNRITGAIGGVNDHLGHMSDRMWTTALSDKDMYWQGVVTQKDCCCEQKEIAMSEGCKTRETICCDGEKTRFEIRRQTELIERLDRERDKVAIVDLKNENSNLRQTGELMGMLGKIMGRLERLEDKDHR